MLKTFERSRRGRRRNGVGTYVVTFREEATITELVEARTAVEAIAKVRAGEGDRVGFEVHETREPYAGEVDHAQLVDQLVAEFPDGWALSTSAHALPRILPLCPPNVRVAAWHRAERPVRSWGPLNGWEPVIFTGGRPLMRAAAGHATRRVDSLVYRPGVRTTDPARVIGAKPAVFIRWVFDLLGALPGDEFVDLFPGSGGVDRAWQTYTSGGTR